MWTAIHLAIAVFASLAWSIVAMLLMRAAGVDLKNVTAAFKPRAIAIAAASYAIILATTLGLASSLDSLGPAALGFELDGFAVELGIGEIALTLVMLAGFVTLQKRLLGVVGTERASTNPRWVVAPLLFGGALWEEALYRGYFLALLAPRGVAPSIAVSAAVFTAIHFVTSKGTAFRAFNWLVGGVALAAIYLDTKSIWVATAAHFARNLGNAFFLLPESGVTVVSFARPIPEPVRTAWYVVLSIATVALAHFARR
jgi:membrane protease YdiL (CAAX protease family)